MHRSLKHSLETCAMMLAVGVENEKKHFIMQTNIYMTIHKKWKLVPSSTTRCNWDWNRYVCYVTFFSQEQSLILFHLSAL